MLNNKIVTVIYKKTIGKRTLFSKIEALTQAPLVASVSYEQPRRNINGFKNQALSSTI